MSTGGGGAGAAGAAVGAGVGDGTAVTVMTTPLRALSLVRTGVLVSVFQSVVPSQIEPRET